MDKRLIQALVAYAVLGVAAWFLLSGKALLIVAVALAAFALKSVLWQFKPED